MAKSELNQIINPPEEVTKKSEESEIIINKYKQEFENCKVNLETDIEHLNTRLGLIQSYITGIDTQLSNLKNLIKNCQNPNEKGKLYNLLNQALELNVRYQELYLKALDIKRNYRKEQDEFTYKKIRFVEIEIKKAEGEQDERGLTPTKLLQVMRDLQTEIHKETKRNDETPKEQQRTNPVTEALTLLDDDPDYRIG